MDITRLYRKFRPDTGVSTDSRLVSKGQIFFALRGNRYNGNDFASDALQAGASMAVVDDPAVAVDEKYWLVEDALRAMQNLAARHRQEFAIPVIGITGSNGKTTTRELLQRVLSKRYRVHSTRENLNNHIGLPLTLLKMPVDTEMAILEMGANHRGEITKMCGIASPDYGLVTNVGKAHLEGFGSFEGVKAAKGEMYDYIGGKGGVIFYNAGNDELNQMLKGYTGALIPYGTPASLCWGRVSSQDQGLAVRLFLEDDDTTEVKTRLAGAYNLENILAAAAVGIHFRIPVPDIREAIEGYRACHNRSQRIKTRSNILILDAYNANPTSMHAALDAFTQVAHQAKVLIIGEMCELGPSANREHQELVDRLSREGFREVYLVGNVFKDIVVPGDFRVFETTGELGAWLQRHALKERMILIKGSRAVGLERITGSL